MPCPLFKGLNNKVSTGANTGGAGEGVKGEGVREEEEEEGKLGLEEVEGGFESWGVGEGVGGWVVEGGSLREEG